VPTPAGAEPDDVLAAVKTVLETLGVSDADVPLGVAFPAIVKNGKTLSAANVAETWVGFEAEKFFEDGLGREIHFANDADVAGVRPVTAPRAMCPAGAADDARHGHRHRDALQRRAHPERGARSPAAREPRQGCRGVGRVLGDGARR
jgi:hypothetical protein